MALVKVLFNTVAITSVSMLLDQYVLSQYVGYLYLPSTLIPFVPKAYGLVVLINIVGTAFLMVTLGGQVGAARKKYTEKALKDGDTDAEARFSYPKLYAEGFSEHAKNFNCVQRGHQQALETYTSFVVLALVAGIKYPLTSCLAGAIWIAARAKWADGYATGDPSKRYSHWISVWIWITLLMQMVAAITTCVYILL